MPLPLFLSPNAQIEIHSKPYRHAVIRDAFAISLAERLVLCHHRLIKNATQVDPLAFVGTIDLVDKQAHLGSTGDSDYLGAVGQYSGWGSAKVTGAVDGGELKYTAEFTYHIWDPYDWDSSRIGVQGALARMHTVGLARQYMTSGEHHVTLSWTKDHPPQVIPAP